MAESVAQAFYQLLDGSGLIASGTEPGLQLEPS
jgi:hypothetical protein